MFCIKFEDIDVFEDLEIKEEYKKVLESKEANTFVGVKVAKKLDKKS